jgi:hypothetical protein
MLGARRPQSLTFDRHLRLPKGQKARAEGREVAKAEPIPEFNMFTPSMGLFAEHERRRAAVLMDGLSLPWAVTNFACRGESRRLVCMRTGQPFVFLR